MLDFGAGKGYVGFLLSQCASAPKVDSFDMADPTENKYCNGGSHAGVPVTRLIAGLGMSHSRQEPAAGAVTSVCRLPPFVKIRNGSGRSIEGCCPDLKKSEQPITLLICYPSPGDLMALQALSTFKGDVVVFVGMAAVRLGNYENMMASVHPHSTGMAERKFYERLWDEFNLIEQHVIPSHFFCLDAVSVFLRIGSVAAAHHDLGEGMPASAPTAENVARKNEIPSTVPCSDAVAVMQQCWAAFQDVYSTKFSRGLGCVHCGAQKDTLSRCSGCRMFWFCDSDCMREGWKSHKSKCKDLQKGFTPSPPVSGVLESQRSDQDQVLTKAKAGSGKKKKSKR